MSSAWVHNLNPFLIEFSSGIGIRWYGLAYLAGFIIGGFIMHFIVKRGRKTLPAEQIGDFVTYGVLGVMLGGRVGYALFYGPDLFASFTSVQILGFSVPIWSVLAVWEGGMASHGGIFGLIVASLLYARKHNLDWKHLGDLTCLGGSVGIFFGRLANFFNGELIGREAPEGLAWAVKFPQDIHQWISQKDAYRIAGLHDAALAIGVQADKWSQWMTQWSTSFEVRNQLRDTMDQIILSIQNGNEVVRSALAPFLIARHPSQIYEALLEGLFCFTVCFIFWYKPRKPGVVGSLWLTTYALVRIIGEQFRMPDAHIGFQLFGLTRGQWLSIGQLALSAALLVYCLRNKTEKIAGWGPEAVALKNQDDSDDKGKNRKAKK